MKTFLLIHFISFLGLLIAAPTNIGELSSQKVAALKTLYNNNQNQQNKAASENIDENGIFTECKPITVLFAKGTSENGNVGDGHSPGPAWFKEMRSHMGEENISVQGVPYSATFIGFLNGGDPAGSQKLLDLTNQVVLKCPKSRIVIGGYSQGAQLVHNAARYFTEDAKSRIYAVVLFGDPELNEEVGQLPPSEILTICHDQDIVCRKSGNVDSHLNYSEDAEYAYRFVWERLYSDSS